jgi:hypothetical protein
VTARGPAHRRCAELAAHAFQVDAACHQRPCSSAALDSDEPEQEVLRRDLLGAELVGFLLRAHHDLARDASEAAKPHPSSPVPGETRGARPAHTSIDRLVTLDDLVHALMAQVERLGDLPHRPAGRVQAANPVVVVQLRPVGLVLELEEARAELASLGEYSFV